MCGIWALISKKKIGQFGYLYDAFMQIKPRGPEFSSFDLVNPFALLGFHRLAIMDITAEGNQPFKKVRSDGSCVYCVCNGEIYDHQRLKNFHKLKTNSHSDCEVILPLFEKLGISETISQLGSEFAFMILDISGPKIKITVGRDPIGVRPLFYAVRLDGTEQNGIENVCFSSEMKGLCDVFCKSTDSIHVFPPGHFAQFDVNTEDLTSSELVFTKYYDCGNPKNIISVTNMENIYCEVRQHFINAVHKRLMTDRDFGCLLSGGLDSSLTCAVAKSLTKHPFPVFTIAFESGSSDLPYAEAVAKHLDLQHIIIKITEEDALKEIDETIFAIESWDITTIRASVMQRMIAKYISRNTDIRVLLVGENSDELFLGYLYEHNAPSSSEAHKDSIRLVTDVHRFDGLRADRCMSYHGLEVRLPFADTPLLDYVFGLPSEFVVPQKGVEKALLRNAFKHTNMLPQNVLFRTKEALSDGVSTKSKSWYQVIQEHIETLITDKEFEREKGNFKHCPPFSKESYYYRKKFVEYFGVGESIAQTIPYFWMPKWTETNDPSARTLKKYDELLLNK